MAVTRRFTRQIVIVTTQTQGAKLIDLSNQFGISQAQVARDALTIALPKLAEKYRKDGLTERVKARKASLESPFVAPTA